MIYSYSKEETYHFFLPVGKRHCTMTANLDRPGEVAAVRVALAQLNVFRKCGEQGRRFCKVGFCVLFFVCLEMCLILCVGDTSLY